MSIKSSVVNGVKVPDNVINKKLYAKIKKQMQKEHKDAGKRWSAYASGHLVKKYKSLGGKYHGVKKNTSLDRWFKEKWIDVCYWPEKKKCGRKGPSSRPYPYCRPSVKVDHRTPKTVQELTEKQRKARCAKKRKNPKTTIN